MAKDPFFTIRPPFTQVDENGFKLLLAASKHISGVMYMPDLLSQLRIENVTFENVSFAKTLIQNVNFKNCKFKDCLFIATELSGVEFHGCVFEECNFFKSRFESVYGRPSQFAGAVSDHSYANVAVHLFQELRDNYADEMQPEFRGEAEYYFRVWGRRLLWSKFRGGAGFKQKTSLLLAWLLSLLHGALFGYGFRLRHLLATTLSVVLLLAAFAFRYGESLFVIDGVLTPVRAIYFTVTTMITMGAAGFSPIGNAGHIFVIVNALAGVVLVTATVSSIAKRVAR